MDSVISNRGASKIVNSAFENKIARRSVFYIKYGPPGSGKGGIMTKALEKDGLSEKSVVTVEVDSIIESIPGYIDQRQKLINSKATPKEKTT